MRTGNWGHGKPQAVPTVSSYTVALLAAVLITKPSGQVPIHDRLMPGYTNLRYRYNASLKHLNFR